jgi:hypothetical protein
MKNLILLIAASLLTFNSFAQKCKEVIDPITKEKKYEFISKDKYASMGNLWGNVTYEKNGSEITLIKPILYTGGMSIIAPSGMEISFILKDGKVLTLKTKGEVSPSLISFGVIYSSYNFTFILTKDDLAKLALSPVVFMRVPKISSAGHSDLDKKDLNISKSSKAIMKGAECMGMY